MCSHELAFCPKRLVTDFFPRPELVQRSLFVLALLASLTLTSCQKRDASSSEKLKSGLKVRFFAAASTIDAVTEACQQFTKETGIDVETSFAASSTQATMLLQGVRADLFLSASVQWSDAIRKELPDCDTVNLLGNRLVLVVPIESWLDIKSIAEVNSDEVHKIAIADYKAVPAGIYSKQALENAGLWDAVSTKLVGTLDVRQALTMVENGVVDCGFVYQSDAQSSKLVRIVAEVAGHDPVVYPLLLLPNASVNGRALFDFLQADKVQKVFERHGFQVLPVPFDAGSLVK
jgi:molybdate transport system substrate-binding protein